MGGAQSSIANGVWSHEGGARTSKNSFSPNPNPHNDNRRCSHHRQVRCYSRHLVSRTQSHPATVNSTRPLHPHQPIRSRISLDVISEDFRVNARRRKQLIPRAKLIAKKAQAEERSYSTNDGTETPLENFPLLRRVKTRNNLAEFIAEQQLLISGGAKPLTQSPNIVELYENGEEVPRYVESENPYSVLLDNYNTYAKNRGLDNVSLKGSIRERFRKSSATSLGSKNKFKMSRRPQILHIVDSANSRQKNQTYTKNTSKGLASGIKKSYEVSDWETYSVLPQNGQSEKEEGQDEMSEICLNDLSQSKEFTSNDNALEKMMQNVENTYATIQKRHLDDMAMDESGNVNSPNTDQSNITKENDLNQSEESTIHVEIHDTSQGDDGMLKIDNHAQNERLEVESPIQNFSEVQLAPSRTESPVRNISPVGAKESSQLETTRAVNGDVDDAMRPYSVSPLKNFSEVKLENVQLGSPILNVTQAPAKEECPKSETPTQICQETKIKDVEMETPKIVTEEEEPKQEVTKNNDKEKENTREVKHTPFVTGVKLQNEPKRTFAQNGHEMVREKVSISDLKCVFEDTKTVGNGNVKKMITRSESLASVVPAATKPSTEMEKLREMHKVENKGIDSQMSKMNSDANESEINSFTKERSRSLLNLNSAQTEKIRFKKLGSKIECRENKFNKKNIYNEVSCTKGHFKVLGKTPSINRSMPEYLNESFVIENPNNQIRAIENQLNHIHQTNVEKVQNTSKVGLKKCVSYPNDHQLHKKVSKAPNCNNVDVKSESTETKCEKSNNLIENIHEKLVQTKSNEERSTNCENMRKVAAFDGLLQYLRDYRLGLRELLVNNNVVIIEPVRESTVRLEDERGCIRDGRSGSTEGACRITGATVKNIKPLAGKKELSYTLSRQQINQPKIKRHFFYHPCNKVNPYLVDKELPDPDLVKKGRQKYEEFLKLKVKKEEILSGNATPIKTRSKFTEDVEKPVLDTKHEDPDNKTGDDPANKRKLHRFLTVDTVFRDKILKRWTDSGSLSSGISSDLSCCDTDLESPGYDMKHDYSSDDEYFDSFNSKNFEVEYHYVAPEVLEKIRACGESTTYYGGRIVSSTKGTSPMNCIMNEIQEDSRGRNTNKNYLGVKFRLVKSNSCGSRLELAGAEETPSAKPLERSQTFYKTSNTTVDKDMERSETFYKILNKKEDYTQEINNVKPYNKLNKNEDAVNPKPVTFFSHVPNDMDFGSKTDNKSKPQIELKLVETKQNGIQFGQTTEGMDLPKIKVQKVVEEIEALNFDVKRFENKSGTHPGALGKESKTQILAMTETQDEKNWKQEFTYKAMARKYEMIENETSEETVVKEKPPQEKVINKALDNDKTGEIKAKKEIVEYKEVYENIKRVNDKLVATEAQKVGDGVVKIAENRAKVVPKVLLSIEKTRGGCNKNGYGTRRVCDMEFETFEVLDTSRGSKTTPPAETHVCADDEPAEDTCPAEDIDRDSLTSIDNDPDKVPMTSWANHHKAPLSFDFRNSEQSDANATRTNQSSC